MVTRLPSDLDVTDTNNTAIPNSSGGSDNCAEGSQAGLLNNNVRSLAAIIAAAWGGMYSGSTRPAAVQSGSLWLDTSGGATANIVKFYDGTHDITLFTVNTTANTSAPEFIDFLASLAALAADDTIPVYDDSAATQRKVTFANFVASVGNLSAITLALDDRVAISDTSATAGGRASIEDILAAVNLLTEDTSPDTANDFLLAYDASASAAKKVQLDQLIGTRQTQSAATTSGTEVNVTGIIAGAVQVEIYLKGVSTDSTNSIGLLMGASGGVESSGYSGSTRDLVASTTADWSTTNQIDLGLSVTAASAYNGKVTLTLLDSATNLWGVSGRVNRDDEARVAVLEGTKALSGELDRIQLVSTDDFDLGDIYVIARDG